MKPTPMKRRRMSHHARVLLLAAAVAYTGALALAPPAGATVTCTFTTDQVNVQMNEPGDVAKLEIGGGGTILVDNATGPVICGPGGPPTVNNTDKVAIADTSDNPGTPAPTDGTTRVEISEPSAFVPGATLTGENGGLGEIEFALYLNDGSDDTILLRGANPGADVWVMGAGGINWNAGANDPAADPDLTSPSDVDHWNLLPVQGDDRVSAQGGSGTGAPFPGRVEVGGDNGDDVIGGGEGNVGPNGDQLSGGAGNDVIRGFGGDDLFYAADGGNDTLDGGPGEDELTYYGLSSGVRVDLSTTGTQDTIGAGIDTTAGIEDVTGTEQADTLIGNAAFNYLDGVQGDDMLDGGPGDDALTGGGDVDTVTYAQAPVGVTADLTSGNTSGFGNDGIADVENLIGSPFADTLIGSAQPNSLTGLGGADTISALAGRDTVDVRDGGPDTASCGTEVDTAVADRASVDAVNADCETVDFLPDPDPGSGGAGGGAGPDTELGFELSGKRKQRVLRQRGVVVRAFCPLEDCNVTASGSGKVPKPKRAALAKLNLKPVTEALAAGTAERIELPLRKRQLRAVKTALGAGRRPVLKVSVSVTDAAGNATADTLKVKARR